MEYKQDWKIMNFTKLCKEPVKTSVAKAWLVIQEQELRSYLL